MKQQVVVIHGGDTFGTREEYLLFLKNYQIDFERYRTGKTDWKHDLGAALGSGYEVILPDMPNKRDAKYAEWKIWFEKFVPYLGPQAVLVGHSLGGTFLAKYLSENDLPKAVRAVFLIAAPYDDRGADYSLADFTLPDDLDRLERQARAIFLYYSKDDPVVPFADLGKYQSSLKGATARTFADRGHLNQESFPELVEDIKHLDFFGGLS